MELKQMSYYPVENLNLADRLFFGIGEIDWLIEQGLIYEEETCP